MDSRKAGGLIVARRRGRRRTRRNTKSKRHGGFGSPGKNPNKKKKKVNRARQKLNKKIKSKSLKSRVKSVTKAVAKNKADSKKKTISASQSRRQVRQKVKDKIATRKKITLRSVVNNLTKGAAAHASGVNTKPKSKLQRQLSNLRSRIKQQSTPEAKKKRRADRLRKQHGLDYSRMNDSFKANVNVSQAYKHLGLDKYAPTRAVYNRLPTSIKNFSWKHQFKAPTKLGISDGYRSPNRGRPIPRQLGGQDAATQRSLRGRFDIRPVRGVPGGRTPNMGPQQDWLSRLYRSHNISGGKLDQGARDYWSNEAKTKGRDAVMQSIIGTSKAQGTYGGRRRPRRIDAGDGMPKAVPLPWFGAISAGRGLIGGVKAAKSAKRKAKLQNEATERQYQYDKKAYNLQAKGAKRRMAKSLAAHIAATRGM